MGIVSGGGGGGNTTAQVVASGKVLPVAAATGVTVDTTTYANAITGSGFYTTLVFPAGSETAALAIATAGDAFPTYLIGNLGGDGISIGDGVVNPYSNGGSIQGNANLMTINGGGAALAVGSPDANAGALARAFPGLKLGNGSILQSGTGAPAVGGNVGDIYIRKDGGALTTLYRCTVAGIAGAATWAAIL